MKKALAAFLVSLFFVIALDFIDEIGGIDRTSLARLGYFAGVIAGSIMCGIYNR